MMWLHETLAERETFDQTQAHFESLRAYGLLPSGRENASVRLSLPLDSPPPRSYLLPQLLALIY